MKSRFIAAAALLAVAALPALADRPDSLPDFRSRFYAVGARTDTPGFSYFSVDSLGRGELDWNPILRDDTMAVRAVSAPSATTAAEPMRFTVVDPSTFVYSVQAPGGERRPVWTLICRERSFVLRSEFVPGAPAAPPFALVFDQKANHATLLGLMKAGERSMALPCVLHLPDMGSVRIVSSDAPSIDYDARRYVKAPYVAVSFPPATAARPRVEYALEVAAIHPDVPGIGADPLYDGFRRSFLNLFQVNPRVRMLANNSSSDPVPFTVYMAAEMARATPPLAPGLTAFDLVRMTLDRYLSGAKGYGQVGYAVEPGDADLVPWRAPWNSLDAYPSLVIAAAEYVLGADDRAWGAANFDRVAAWAREMMAADRDGDGLIEHPHTGNSGDRATESKRPANWWDTINFGHEDAYSNALAYRACVRWAEAARALGREADAAFFAERAAKLRASYLRTFLDPATGVLAGWKSADGQLHDYYFTFVNGMAVTYGLVDASDGNRIMDRLLAKMDVVGFRAFRYGLPGNLVPIRMSDYVLHHWPGARAIGEPFIEDGSDAFERYENGGATACHAWFTVKALYALGRVADARRIFRPMLESYARGEFQGFGANGKSKDWRDWDGGCNGYEGLLCDGFLALLCVFDDAAAAGATLK